MPLPGPPHTLPHTMAPHPRRRRRTEELEALRRAEEELMERRRQELLADEGSHWRQRMEAERLIAAQAALELELGAAAQVRAGDCCCCAVLCCARVGGLCCDACVPGRWLGRNGPEADARCAEATAGGVLCKPTSPGVLEGP